MGNRRGRYKSTAEKDEGVEPEWSAADYGLLSDLIAKSPLLPEIARERLAIRAVESDRQCQRLDRIIRNADEEKAFNAARARFQKELEALKLTREELDDEGDDDDEE